MKETPREEHRSILLGKYTGIIFENNVLLFCSFLGFKNIAMYLTSKMGTPQDVIMQEVNLDNDGRNLYHQMCYRGNYECCLAMLNLERVYLKKTLFD